VENLWGPPQTSLIRKFLKTAKIVFAVSEYFSLEKYTGTEINRLSMIIDQ
jgi:hypothetical protein